LFFNQTKIEMLFFNSLIAKTSSIRSLFCLFLSSHVILLLMMTYTFPRINDQIGTNAFDLQTFGYSVFEARSILTNLNDQTIDLYLFPQLTLLDLFYPVLIAFFLSSFLFRLFNLTKTKKNSILLMAPFFAMLFDYLENVCIIFMITNSAETSESIIFLSSAFTISKGVLTSFAWIGILLYSFKWVRIKILERKSNQPLSKPKLY